MLKTCKTFESSNKNVMYIVVVIAIDIFTNIVIAALPINIFI